MVLRRRLSEMESRRSYCRAWRVVTEYTIIVRFSVVCFSASTTVHAERHGGIAEFALSYDIPRITFLSYFTFPVWRQVGLYLICVPKCV